MEKNRETNERMLKFAAASSMLILPMALYTYQKFILEPVNLRKIIEKIKSYDELNFILQNNGKHPLFYISKINKYPFLNDYIDEYFKIYPEEFHSNDVQIHAFSEVLNLLEQENIMKTVEILLKHSRDPKHMINSCPNVFKCCFSSNPVNKKIIKLLLDNGANPNKNEFLDNSALHIAVVIKSGIEFIELLFEYGADPNIKNEIGITPLMILLCRPEFETKGIMIKKLIEYNADIELENDEGNNSIVYASNYGIIQYILPNRKKFLEKISTNVRLLEKYLLIKPFDFKIGSKSIDKFMDVIRFL